VAGTAAEARAAERYAKYTPNNARERFLPEHLEEFRDHIAFLERSLWQVVAIENKRYYYLVRIDSESLTDKAPLKLYRKDCHDDEQMPRRIGERVELCLNSQFSETPRKQEWESYVYFVYNGQDTLIHGAWFWLNFVGQSS